MTVMGNSSSSLLSVHIQLRRTILNFLYDHFKKGRIYVEGEEIVNKIQADKLSIYSNLRYLEDKRLITVIWRTGGYPVTKVTSAGIDLIEDENEFNRQFPISVNNISYDSSIHIGSIGRDATGIGVSGSQNVIGKNIATKNVQLYKVANEWIKSLEGFMKEIEKYDLSFKKIKSLKECIDNFTRELKSLDE